ncbi:D-aminoacyl-tRNA deacylase [Lapidilactobacillus wuchangensis]|uniref:D-aminoacyl-tRNA deacylase n=1 Tax=Lapidilactobacillus wuchangensis TaxID=2486001 RepID=UPI000F79C144|nr:D-aminoacyl-tRNA deacylase [Lapidilactobacillus wuchangensis]
MRVTLQRVKSAQVTVAGQEIGAIQQGLLLFVGIAPDDDAIIVRKMAQKIVKMRIFEDTDGKMNLSLAQINGHILSISQFTLYADTRKGNRPSFQDAAQPALAEQLYQEFNRALTNELGQPVATGEFGADMQITAVNDGPVTINLELPHA